jgi:hypothetical protein
VSPNIAFPSKQDQPRHRCRNPRCGTKLRQPTDHRLEAFCCEGCFESFYRSRCIVCERPIAQKTKPRRVCNRQKCRGQFRRHPEQFLSARYPGPGLSQISSGSAHFTGLKIGQKGGRPFRIVAGPTSPEINLRIRIDPELIARLDRTHAGYLENQKKAKRRAARQALIKRKRPPVNVLGGFKFPGAPTIDLSPSPAPGWAMTSNWKPTDGGAEFPPIPQFLRREVPAAPATEPQTEEADPMPGIGLTFRQVA